MGLAVCLRPCPCGKPPICSLPGHGPREITAQERNKAGNAASWQHPPSFWKEVCVWPIPRPPIASPCSHPDQVFRVLALLSLGIWGFVFPSILHCAHCSIPTWTQGCSPFFPLPAGDIGTILVLHSLTALAYTMGP